MPATAIGLWLDPCDPLLFRDGRPFDAAARVSGGLPNPQTLAGALRTAMLAHMGFDFGAFATNRRAGGIGHSQAERAENIETALRKGGAPAWWMDVRFRGPWPAVAAGEAVEPLFEKPATLYRSKAGAWERAEPLGEGELPGWAGPPRRPLWKKAEPDSKAEGGHLTLTGLTEFLAGRAVPAGEIVPRGVLFGDDDRVGIEIDKDARTSADGMLYSVRLLARNPRLRHDPADGPAPFPGRFAGGSVGFYAEVVLPAGADRADFFAAPTPVPFGGEGKYARVTLTKKVAWPQFEAGRPTGLWYLATPAFLGGTPPLPGDGGAVVAAASGAGVAVSGWDVARGGPRATRFAVPAGAVYFVDHPTRPELDSLDPDRANQLEGWGFALPGTWNGGPTP